MNVRKQLHAERVQLLAYGSIHASGHLMKAPQLTRLVGQYNPKENCRIAIPVGGEVVANPDDIRSEFTHNGLNGCRNLVLLFDAGLSRHTSKIPGNLTVRVTLTLAQC